MRLPRKSAPVAPVLGAALLSACVGYPRVFLSRRSGTASIDQGPPRIKAEIVKRCERSGEETEAVRKTKEVQADQKGRYHFWLLGLGWNWRSLVSGDSCRNAVQLYVCRDICREADEVDIDLLGK